MAQEKLASKENLIKFAPAIIMTIAVISQYNLFVTPQQLEITRREVMQEVASIYVPKEQYNAQYNDLKSQLEDMRRKIDKIYDIVTRK